MRTRNDFDLKRLHDAIDEKRRSQGLSWAAVARQINRFDTGGHPIATSTIRGLETKSTAEGDGVLQMLLWLDRTPESFIAGFPDSDDARYRLQRPDGEYILRWDARALHAALDAARNARGITWQHLGREVGGHTAAMLTHLARGSRTGFPGVMRITRWLDRPACTFTRAVPRYMLSFSAVEPRNRRS
jgi:hypothetical protein